MSEAIAKPRSKSLQRRDAKLALKASKRYKRMQQREPAPKLTGKQRVLNWLLHIIMASPRSSFAPLTRRAPTPPARPVTPC